MASFAVGDVLCARCARSACDDSSCFVGSDICLAFRSKFLTIRDTICKLNDPMTESKTHCVIPNISRDAHSSEFRQTIFLPRYLSRIVGSKTEYVQSRRGDYIP